MILAILIILGLIALGGGTLILTIFITVPDGILWLLSSISTGLIAALFFILTAIMNKGLLKGT